MKPVIDHENCVGCGLCADTCPEVYAMKDSIAAVIVDPVPEADAAACREAAANCPVEAIAIHE
jgi:ferredoxin